MGRADKNSRGVEEVKNVIRNEIRRKRDSMNPKDKAAWDSAIFDKLISIEEVQACDVIFAYVSFTSEVETRQLIEWAFREKKRVAIPKIDLKTHEIVPYLIQDLNADTEKGHFGVLEPKETRTEIISIEKIDIFIVPGLAFCLSGHRIGYGGKYFDKFLKHLSPDSKQLKIGVAYDFQILPQIPIRNWDIPVDRIVTEKTIYISSEQDYDIETAQQYHT